MVFQQFAEILNALVFERLSLEFHPFDGILGFAEFLLQKLSFFAL